MSKGLHPATFALNPLSNEAKITLFKPLDIMQSKGNYFFVKKCELKTNFTQIPNIIFELNLSATDKLILIYLFSNAENFRITNYRIKKSLGCDFRTVKKALLKFKSLGLISNINEYTIEINVKNFYANSSNSTSSNSTSSNSTSSTITTTIGVELPPYSSTITPNIVVELHNNNTKQHQPQEEKQKEQKIENLGLDDNLILTSNQIQNINSSKKESKEDLKQIPKVSIKEQELILNKFNLNSFCNEKISNKYIEYCKQYTPISFVDYLDLFIALLTTEHLNGQNLNLINKDKIKFQLSISTDINDDINHYQADAKEFNYLKNLSNKISTIIN